MAYLFRRHFIKFGRILTADVICLKNAMIDSHILQTYSAIIFSTISSFRHKKLLRHRSYYYMLFLYVFKEVNAIAEVIRVFEDSEIIHVAGLCDPLSDIDIIECELILKDIENVEKRIPGAESDLKGRKQNAAEILSVLHVLKKGLSSDIPAGEIFIHTKFSERETDIAGNLMNELQLLTAKPFIYIFNASESQIKNAWQPDEQLRARIGKSSYTVISAKIESELNELNGEERLEYLETLGIRESGLDRVIRLGYETLGLITFFTTGEDETRAWTIPQESKAPRAGRAIHSDFEEKFIR